MTAGHDHGSANPRARDTRYLSAALTLLLAFMAAEVVVGIIASSLALISDAAHMLTDAAALALALLAWLSPTPTAASAAWRSPRSSPSATGSTTPHSRWTTRLSSR